MFEPTLIRDNIYSVRPPMWSDSQLIVNTDTGSFLIFRHKKTKRFLKVKLKRKATLISNVDSLPVKKLLSILNIKEHMKYSLEGIKGINKVFNEFKVSNKLQKYDLLIQM